MVTQSNTSNTTKQHDPERLLRWPEVQARVGLCKSYCYVLQHKGLFPKSIKFTDGGRAVGYLESEINQFINNRIVQSRMEKTNENS